MLQTPVTTVSAIQSYNYNLRLSENTHYHPNKSIKKQYISYTFGVHVLTQQATEKLYSYLGLPPNLSQVKTKTSFQAHIFNEV